MHGTWDRSGCSADNGTGILRRPEDNSAVAGNPATAAARTHLQARRTTRAYAAAGAAELSSAFSEPAPTTVQDSTGSGSE